MARFAHIADTHIRNLKYHSEYRTVFEKMYNMLREEKVDYIIHCGDIAHTKTQISPEFVDMTANFFKELSSIAPTYIILGNHDGNLKNDSRQDALTPIIEALNLPNLHLLKSAGETVLDKDFTINVLSVFDEDNWVQPSNADKINIALYHGAVGGVVTDTGWIMEHGDHDIAVFEEFDYAFLGDIHKTNQILDTEGRVRYPGSTVQQNHGETNDKGFLIWDIESKDKFSVKHHIIENPRPFVTIELTKSGRIPKNTTIPEGARLRVATSHSIPIHKLRRALDTAKAKFKPTSVTFLNRASGVRRSVDIEGNLIQEDLRNIAVQEKFFKQFLEDYEVADEMFDRICALNKQYNTIVEDGEDVKRNVRWNLKSLEWDNLFNYGEKNRIDFEKTNGIVGIFGKNFSGKSSIIDSLLFTVYNSSSKGNRKNFNTINQRAEWGKGKVEIDVGDNTLIIERDCEKYVKKLRGEETDEAKTNVTFSTHNPITNRKEPLNGLDRNGTDKNIRKYFGTLDDFLLTSMASQLGSLDFIGEGSTKRKEILAKFLDLEIFDKKFKLAKDDASDLKAILKRLEDVDFDAESEVIENQLVEHNKEVREQRDTCSFLKNDISTHNLHLSEIQASIDAIPAEIINIEEVTDMSEKKKKASFSLENKNKKLEEESDENRDIVAKIDSLCDEFNIDEWTDKQEMVQRKKDALDGVLRLIREKEATRLVEEKKVQLLNEVPCGDQFPQCKFIRDAFTALESIGITKKDLDDARDKERSVEEEISTLQPDIIAEYIEKHRQVVEKRTTTEAKINKLELQIAKNKTKILNFDSEVRQLGEKIKEYEENRDAIENLEQLIVDQNKKIEKIKEAESKLVKCENRLTELYKESGSLSQKLESLSEQKEELSEAREEYAAYDLFMRCVHTNGISLDIIKNRLPIINAEIASTLANIVDFEVYVEDNDKKLEIFIKHPKFDARPLEMGSGAEKTIAAMAIRLSLLSVSSMPKGDIFILDEPGTALDEENMEGFIRILDLVKTHFKTVLLISHQEALKDSVDSQISIEKKDGFAYVNH